jgi:hypothetical protein
MNEFLSFRKMITPLLIQVIFWVFILFTVVGAFIWMFTLSFWLGLVYLILGPLLVRIYCELLILFFRMYEELTSIRQALGGQPPAAPQGFPVTPVAPVVPPAA